MLEDVRVVDATRLLPGPYAGWLMAQMGAEVIKVDEPGRGDYIRNNWPRRAGTSNVFHLYNRGKKSIALNLKTAEGRGAFLDLVETADVILEGNRPGVMDRLGCGWAACRERNRRLVYCSITGFGQTGPYRNRVGHDINYLSLAGLLSGLSERGRPITPRATISDMAGGGLMAAVGLLGALVAARASGQGRFVDISMTDAVFTMQGLRLSEDLLPGDHPPSGWVAPDGDDFEIGVYEAADGGFISLDPYENKFKETLWSIIEREGCGMRPDRQLGRAAVRAALAEAIARRPRRRWVELLSEAEVCFAPVYVINELPDDPNLQARGMFGDSLDPTTDSPTLGSPIHFDPPALKYTLPPAPRLGEHTESVLAQLGWSSERITAAIVAGDVAASDS